MSLNNEDVVTPSIDRHQPQHVRARRHAQLTASPEVLQQTGNRNQPREDDVIDKMASQVTADVIKSAVQTYAAEQSLSSAVTGSEQHPLSPDREPAEVSSAAIQPPSVARYGTEDKHSTGNQSPSRSTDVAAVSSDHSKSEALSTTSGDGPEAEALQDIARLQALTRQLRAAVAESRSADGLPFSVDDNEANLSSKDLDQQQTTQKTMNKENDETVSSLYSLLTVI